MENEKKFEEIREESGAKKKAPLALKKYDEIETELKKAKESSNVELILLLNELTLSRNLEENKSQVKKEFKTVFVAFKSNNKVIKRAGIYNAAVFPDAEEAEDLLISENFDDDRILAVPRNSLFVI